jgi:hypothetical protein
MTDKHFYTSLTRISNVKEEVGFSVEKLPREEWGTGDYVLGEVDSPPRGLDDIELDNGREVQVVEVDLIVCALGERYATLEEVGRCQDSGTTWRWRSSHRRVCSGRSRPNRPPPDTRGPPLRLRGRGAPLGPGPQGELPPGNA